MRSLLVTVMALALAAPAGAATTWRLEQPDPPPGSPYAVPLGRPGDLQVVTPSRALMAVEGNAVVPTGLYTWDGRTWRALSSVCGGSADTTRVAVAGPTEWWTIADPAAEQNDPNRGITLCHFLDGRVIDSYAVPDDVNDPYFPMNAATCNGPADCWFGGIATQTASGSHRGGFHLHWDGGALAVAYNAQGRGVSDLEALGGRVVETSFAGARAGQDAAPLLAQPEEDPVLTRTVTLGGFPPLAADLPEDVELLALDGGDGGLWAVGGGAQSGPGVPDDPHMKAAEPVVLRATDGGFARVPIPAGTFDEQTRLVDVAAIPGTTDAWVAVAPFYEEADPASPARVARVGADGTVSDIVELPEGGAPRGSAAKLACLGPADCFMVTSAGWVFHWTDDDAPLPPQDTNPAYANPIDTRPADGRTPQAVIDALPEDDSRRFEPPPAVVEPEPEPGANGRRPALIKGVKSRLRRGRILELRFRLVRRARVGVVAKRRGKVVGRVKPRPLRPGRRVLRLRLDPKRWPTKVSFITRESSGAETAPDDDSTVTTP